MLLQLGNNSHPDFANSGVTSSVTTVIFPDTISISEAFTTLTNANGVWANHSEIDSTTGRLKPPTWVYCDNGALANLVSDNYGCPIQGVPQPDTITYTNGTTSVS